MGMWTGLWALVTKLFAGRQQFWRHVRIASAALVAAQCVSGVVNLLAFMFSWEALARYDNLISVPVLACGVFMHLKVIAPKRRRTLMATVAAAVALGIPAMLGTYWLQNKRLSGQLYMSSLFPPSWRVAPTVPVQQLIGESSALRALLEQRIKDKEQEDADGGDNEE